MSDNDDQKIPADKLEFREITWGSPSRTIYALEENEAVHPLRDEYELASHRLAPTNSIETYNRHCYGLFVPGEQVPVACVYVDLQTLPESDGRVANRAAPHDITAILDSMSRPLQGKPNTGVFYSITNITQAREGRASAGMVTRGTNGRTPGEELINRVAAHLGETYAIKNFFTISPVRRGKAAGATGFAQWLKQALEVQAQGGKRILTPTEEEVLGMIGNKIHGANALTPYDTIVAMHEKQPYQSDYLPQLMRKLGLHYLVEEKAQQKGSKPLDSVAQFHLSNGGMIAAIHYQPAALTTPSENNGSLGVMASYRYELDKLDERKAGLAKGIIAIDGDLRMMHEERLARLQPPETPSTAIADTPPDHQGMVAPVLAAEQNIGIA